MGCADPAGILNFQSGSWLPASAETSFDDLDVHAASYLWALLCRMKQVLYYFPCKLTLSLRGNHRSATLHIVGVFCQGAQRLRRLRVLSKQMTWEKGGKNLSLEEISDHGFRLFPNAQNLCESVRRLTWLCRYSFVTVPRFGCLIAGDFHGFDWSFVKTGREDDASFWVSLSLVCVGWNGAKIDKHAGNGYKRWSRGFSPHAAQLSSTSSI